MQKRHNKQVLRAVFALLTTIDEMIHAADGLFHGGARVTSVQKDQVDVCGKECCCIINDYDHLIQSLIMITLYEGGAQSDTTEL